MTEKKEKKSAWFYVMIIMGFFFVWLVLAQVINESSDNDSIYYKESISGDYSTSYEKDESSQTISLNGINMDKTLNYPSQIIELRLNGNYNIITITKETKVLEVRLNGIGNTINLCSIHSPSIKENGVDNNINYLNC